VISAATIDYFEPRQLVKSLDDYDAYVDRFAKFLPSKNLQAERLAFRRYQASCFNLLLWTHCLGGAAVRRRTHVRKSLVRLPAGALSSLL